MRIIISERQYNWLINEQKTKQDFDNYIKNFDKVVLKDFDKVLFKKEEYESDQFLDKLNASPIKLNMFHITTDGYKIGTGSVSAEGTYKDTNIKLSIKPVGDFKTAMITLTSKF